jgi:hypothetical protein
MMGHTTYSGLLFVLNNAVAVYLAVAAARIMTGPDDRLRRAVMATANFGLVVFGVQMIAGGIGVLTPVWTLVFLAAAAAAVFVWNRRRSGADPRPQADMNNRPEGLWDRVSLVLLLAGLAVWFVYAVLLGTKHGFDDLVYHATIAGGWLVNHRIVLEPMTYQAYYPLNAEMLSSWFMLPYRTDAFASLTALYWAALSALSIVSIVYSLTGSLERARVAAALFVCATGVHALDAYQGIIRSFAAVDLAGPAVLLAAVAVIARPSEDRSAPGAAEVAYLGLLSGFAVGVKVSFAPAALVLMVWLLALRWRRLSPAAAGTGLLLFAAGLVITGAYWYARNWVVCGNPLFPAEFGPFGGPFGKAEQLRTTMMHWIRQAPADGEQWRYILGKLFEWPWQLGVLSLAGYAVAVFRIVRPGSDKKHRGARAVAVILLTIGLVLLLTHPFAPFSGTINRPHVKLRVDLRFLILSFAAGLILLSLYFPVRGRIHRIWTVAGAAVVAVVMAVAGRSGLYFAAGAAAAALFVFVWPLARRFAPGRRTGWIAAALVLVALAAWYPNKKTMSDGELYDYSPTHKVFERLEALPDGTRLAMFTHLPSEYTWYFKLFGRRLQHVPVALNENGAPYRPLHVAWQGRYDGWWSVWNRNRRTVKQQRFYQNIERAGVQYVIVTRPEKRNWPIYYRFMEQFRGAERVYLDDGSAMWKLN